MKFKHIKAVVSIGISVVLACMPVTAIYNKVSAASLENNKIADAADINIDADVKDWAKIKTRTADASNVDYWKAAIASDYSALYICYAGMATTEWDYNYAGNNTFNIKYSDGTQGANTSIRFSAWKGGAVAKDGWYRDINGAVTETINEAHKETAGPYVLEAAIPMDFFANTDFTITFAGTTVDVSDIEVLSKTGEKEEETKPIYEGIVIDGGFKDWAAVEKKAAKCPNGEHEYCLSQTAMVFDGDYVYIYIKDGEGGSAYGAGEHSNGMYSVKTDLGNELVFQLNRDGSITGKDTDGAMCIHVGRQWEIAIPKKNLPVYNKTISFGLYLMEPFITGVSNLDGTGGDVTPDISGMACDGDYSEWQNFKFTTIQYATSGTHNQETDAKGALYSDGSTLYGYVSTTMPAHVKEAGGEFLQGVTIKFNENDKQVFYPYPVSVAEDGTINWNNTSGNLPDGTYEFYLLSTDGWNNSQNINNLTAGDRIYGKMFVTVKNGEYGKNECEFSLELEKIAQKLGCDASDFKQIDAQFIKLGTQWITTAGASSGAWLGLILCIGVTVGVLVHQKKKADRQGA